MVQHAAPQVRGHGREVEGPRGVQGLELLVSPDKAVVVVQVVEEDVGRVLLDIADLHLHAVNLLAELLVGHGGGVPLEELSVGLPEGEVGHVEPFVLLVERGAHEGKSRRFALVETHGGGLVPEGAVPQGEEEVVLVGGDGHGAGFGVGDGGVALPPGVVVDEDVLHGLAVGHLLAHEDRVVVEAVVEDPFLDVEGGFLLLDVVEQHPEFQGGAGDDLVGEDERDDGDEDSEEGQRGHHLAGGDARRLEGDDFVSFAHIAEGHQGGEHHGQGEGHGAQ